VQTWILTFRDIGALDAQLDEAKIALGEVRSLKKLSEMEWAGILGRGPGSLGPQRAEPTALPGRPWRFYRVEKLEPLGDPAFQGETTPQCVWGARFKRRSNRRLYRVRRAGERLDPRNRPRRRPPGEWYGENQ